MGLAAQSVVMKVMALVTPAKACPELVEGRGPTSARSGFPLPAFARTSFAGLTPVAPFPKVGRCWLPGDLVWAQES